MKIDLRTRAGREQEVLHRVRDHKGFSVFWACENLNRAYAIQRLHNSGEIVEVEGGNFPWIYYKLRDGHELHQLS